jgi:hypothetical protein
VDVGAPCGRAYDKTARDGPHCRSSGPARRGNATSDACGIIVAGIVSQGPVSDWKIYVIEDASVQGVSPNEWAAAAIAAMDRYGADRMVAEVNQGGAMVETIVRSIDPTVSYRVRVFKNGVQVRQQAVSDPSWTYSAALQAADGAGVTRIDVVQMSETYSEGPPTGLVLAT